MERQKRQKRKIKILGVTGLALCALCCLLPVAGGLLGAAALASIGSHLETVAIVLLSLSAVFFAIYRYRKSKQPQACNIDCDCTPAASKSGGK